MRLFGRIFFEREGALQAEHVKPKRAEANRGSLETSYSWTERIPHPNNMGNYERWSSDPEAAEALQLLTKLITGVGFRTEMPDGKSEDHPNKVKVDKWADDVGADEHLEKETWQSLGKGFSPSEIITGYDSQLDLKLLPSETFYIYRDKKGTIVKYTQERSMGDIMAEWKGDEMDDIFLIMNQETPLRPYGTSILDSIGNLLDMRAELNDDMRKGVHRWANPIPILQTTKSKDNSKEMKQSIEDRDVDDWVLIYNVSKDDVRMEPLTVEPSARFVPYVEMIYNQIAEGLHAPLLLYLKNATEASAHVVMESVDRFVEGRQRHIRRRYERRIFPRLVDSGPVPKMLFGRPQTGLEKVTVQQLSMLVNSPALAYNQKVDLLKQYGIKLPEPDWKSGNPQPILAPNTPFGGGKPANPAEKPEKTGKTENIEYVVEHLNDLTLTLELIGENYDTGKLSIQEACKMADQAIKVRLQKTYISGYEQMADRMFQRFLAEHIQKVKAN